MEKEKGLAAGALADAAGRSILLRKCLLLCMAATNDYFHYKWIRGLFSELID